MYCLQRVHCTNSCLFVYVLFSGILRWDSQYVLLRATKVSFTAQYGLRTSQAALHLLQVHYGVMVLKG